MPMLMDAAPLPLNRNPETGLDLTYTVRHLIHVQVVGEVPPAGAVERSGHQIPVDDALEAGEPVVGVPERPQIFDLRGLWVVVVLIHCFIPFVAS